MARALYAYLKNRASSFSETVTLVLSCALGWVWLVGGVHRTEMIVGAAVVVLATLFLLLVRHSQANRIQLRWKDVAQGWRLPMYLLVDTRLVILFLFRDCVRPRPSAPNYLVCEFNWRRRDPVIQGRGVLLTIYMTATPNSIVLGIDPESNRMLFHQLERSSLPKMAYSLGAGS